jgi:hypothetical protein
LADHFSHAVGEALAVGAAQARQLFLNAADFTFNSHSVLLLRNTMMQNVLCGSIGGKICNP